MAGKKEEDERFRETRLGGEPVFEGRLLHVYRDRVRLPDGRESTREYIRHPGASAVVLLDGDGRVLLERQWRYPLSRAFWEIPAGKLDGAEDPLVCAKRELSEETGYTAAHISKLTTIATTVGFSNEKIHIYAATGLTPGQQHTDEDEFINVVLVPLNEAVAMVEDGRIIDAKSAVAILMLARQQKA